MKERDRRLTGQMVKAMQQWLAAMGKPDPWGGNPDVWGDLALSALVAIMADDDWTLVPRGLRPVVPDAWPDA